ncbi:DDE superfamily endonuclease domain-containing protein [Penicillium rubens]|uniref:DDE superfamily endonuclease domain-containing protein n=1 Tax=Penicillium rubens TaxID=1108849 RepID=UPI0023A2EC42|nr:DDE superfamily endonuclease domain-containing protein [Penicillium rubens]KAJ5265196.1 DDE superfamily endonuclease domain-containing protein [Penicillium chrysogenum]KAJ5829132.1 DDE superfamily endonuclease domain-containing protein [Penicillium rubens]
MDQEELGSDPTIITSSGEQSSSNETARVMKRARCIARRATTYWETHLKGYPRTSLVIEDSWHYTDRDDEGDILQEVTRNAVVNIARHYHHDCSHPRYR